MGSRTRTILFTDLVGSTAMRAALGDTAFDTLRRVHDQVLEESIARSAGELVKREGDGVMAVFSSAVDAVSCAVAMQQRLARETLGSRTRLVMRVGLSAGDVAEEDGDFHGMPVVQAARLCSAAAGSTIVAADVVRVLAGARTSHSFFPAGAMELKGIPEPVVAWEVKWSADSLPAVMPARLAEVLERSRCVGRERELAEIETIWKSVTSEAEGRGLVLVTGEPGIGKTRLVAQLGSMIADQAIVAHGWCDEDLGVPFQPWVHVLSGIVRSLPDTDIESILRVAPDLVRLVPEIPARFDDITARQSVDAETDRVRLFDAVDALLTRVALRRPLLVVLDDLHWADQPTLALIHWLVHSERWGPILFVGTYRDSDVDRRHPIESLLADIHRDARVTRLALGALDESGLAALVADRLGEDAPPELLRVFYNETEGNPFFTEEVLAHFAETGLMFQREGVWMSDDLASGDFGLPAGVRDLVGRRLARLPEATSELLGVASVMGRDFDYVTVLAAGEFDHDEAIDALDGAIKSGLVREIAGSFGRYTFAHTLIRQTVLDQLTGPRKARLHWRIGVALASTGAPNAVVASHLFEGVLTGDPVRAAISGVSAAEDALQILAAEEARTLAHRAIGVLTEANIDEPKLRSRALLVIGEASVMLETDYGAGRTALIEASRLARQHRLVEEACRAAVAYMFLTTPGAVDPSHRELAVAGIDLDTRAQWRPVLQAIAARYYLATGEHEDATTLINDALRAIDACEPLGKLIVLTSDSLLHEGLPDLGACAARADEIVDLATAHGSRMWTTVGRIRQISAALRAGNRDRFEEILALLTPTFEMTGNVQANLAIFENLQALLDGRFIDAEQRAFDVLGKVDTQSTDYQQATAQIAAAWYLTGRDDDLINALETFPTQQAPQRVLIDMIRISIRARRGERDPAFDTFAADGFTSLPENASRPGTLSQAGVAAAWLRDDAAAAALEPLIAPYADQLFVLGPLVSIPFEPADSVRGLLLHVLGRLDEAIESLEAAAALCQRGRFLPFEVANAHRLAAVLAARNHPHDCARAQAIASKSLTLADELGMQYDSVQAQAVLDQLS
jgi:class 3 adenylate cyclase